LARLVLDFAMTSNLSLASITRLPAMSPLLPVAQVKNQSLSVALKETSMFHVIPGLQRQLCYSKSLETSLKKLVD
jgi:hypothetical protein